MNQITYDPGYAMTFLEHVSELRKRITICLVLTLIVGIFIIAAVLTPPDFVSQLCMAIPLVLLYFAAILFTWVFKLGR